MSLCTLQLIGDNVNLWRMQRSFETIPYCILCMRVYVYTYMIYHLSMAISGMSACAYYDVVRRGQWLF